MDKNKIDIVQPAPKTACEHFSATCSYCKHMRPHIPLQYNQTGQVKIGMVKRPRLREQKSLVDFNPLKLDSKQTINYRDSRSTYLFKIYPYMKTRKKRNCQRSQMHWFHHQKHQQQLQ